MKQLLIFIRIAQSIQFYDNESIIFAHVNYRTFMKTVRITARILTVLMRIVALGYLFFAAYPAFGLLLQWLGLRSAASFIRLDDGGTRFEVLIPFTGIGETFMLGYYQGWYIAKMLTLITSYGIFFWLLSNVFHAFAHKPLFTKQAVERLTAFTVANVLIPFSVAWGIFRNDGDAAVVIIALHLILGVFSYFMTAIFQQGFSLQREQDLIV